MTLNDFNWQQVRGTGRSLAQLSYFHEVDSAATITIIFIFD